MRVGFVVAFFACSAWPVCARADSAGVLVHLESDRDAVLQREIGDDAWITVCRAPCDMRTNADARYRIDGDGIRASSPFFLTASAGGSEALDVNSMPSAGQPTGMLLFVVGVLGGVAGGLITVVGGTAKQCESSVDAASNGTHCELALPEIIPIGLAFLIGGAVTSIAGIVIVANTRVSTVTQIAAASSPRVRWLAGDLVSAPRIREGAITLPAAPATLALPLVTVSF